MEYPIWEVPYLGGSMVIALIAIVHIFIAHFAVGAGIFNACMETFSLRNQQPVLRRFLRDNSRLIILLPFIGGAVTGVGIWFSIALVSPETTSLLIHLFLWGWAIEWVFFLLEIIFGYIYYYSWDRLAPRRHCLVGWVYALAAFLSLVVINGIVSFMLSPVGFDSSTRPMAFAFWPALFNPTYAPSLLLRTVSSLALAALFAMVLVNACRGYTHQQRHTVIRYAGIFLVPLVVMIPAAIWFFYEAPAESTFYVKGGAVAMTLLFAVSLFASTLIGLYGYGAVLVRRRYVNLETSILLLALALMATGASEFVREGIRKPYLIWGHLYSNGIAKARLPSMQRQLEQDPGDAVGALRFTPWAVRPAEAGWNYQTFARLDDQALRQLRSTPAGRIIRGRWLFNGQCLRCHSLAGYNAIRPLVHRWSQDTLEQTLGRLDEIKLFMPPFVGNQNDRRDLALFLNSLDGSQDGPEWTVSRPPAPDDLGQQIQLAGLPQGGSSP
ncbi:MAG: cytochrome ubiquinol oxidase subunit I [Sedimentisphaerales bacterium]|nr:cytochrome ubiquinol oxidase subunit I [Sedimentisphaerales bacterium]